MSRPGSVPAVVVPLLVLALAATGCGGDGADGGADGSADGGSVDRSADSSESPASATRREDVDADVLEGATYVSTSVTGHRLVDGTEVRLAFEDGAMSASAGCNTVFGAYEVDDGLLRWSGPPASTLIGCPDDLDAQDRWLTGLLTDGVTATLADRTLTLSSGDVTLRLADESPAGLDNLLGRTWTLVATIADQTTSRLPRNINRPSLSVGADGLARLDTGCNSGRTTVRVDGDQLVFGAAATTRRACRGPARLVEEALLALVDGGRSDAVEVHDRVLVVFTGERGLVFALDRHPDR